MNERVQNINPQVSRMKQWQSTQRNRDGGNGSRFVGLRLKRLHKIQNLPIENRTIFPFDGTEFDCSQSKIWLKWNEKCGERNERETEQRNQSLNGKSKAFNVLADREQIHFVRDCALCLICAQAELSDELITTIEC